MRELLELQYVADPYTHNSQRLEKGGLWWTCYLEAGWPNTGGCHGLG